MQGWKGARFCKNKPVIILNYSVFEGGKGFENSGRFGKFMMKVEEKSPAMERETSASFTMAKLYFHSQCKQSTLKPCMERYICFDLEANLYQSTIS